MKCIKEYKYENLHWDKNINLFKEQKIHISSRNIAYLTKLHIIIKYFDRVKTKHISNNTCKENKRLVKNEFQFATQDKTHLYVVY